MKTPEGLHEQGRSLWLDNITRELLQTGTLELALEDLTRAADLFRPIWERTRGVESFMISQRWEGVWCRRLSHPGLALLDDVIAIGAACAAVLASR